MMPSVIQFRRVRAARVLACFLQRRRASVTSGAYNVGHVLLRHASMRLRCVRVVSPDQPGRTHAGARAPRRTVHDSEARGRGARLVMGAVAKHQKSGAGRLGRRERIPFRAAATHLTRRIRACHAIVTRPCDSGHAGRWPVVGCSVAGWSGNRGRMFRGPRSGSPWPITGRRPFVIPSVTKPRRPENAVTARKRIALIAQDDCKPEPVEWVRFRDAAAPPAMPPAILSACET